MLLCNEFQIYFADFLRDKEHAADNIVTPTAPEDDFGGRSLSDMHLRVTSMLKKYNIDYPSRQLNIVLFDDALKHVLRIARCLGMSRGSMLLMGTEGTGKQSLTRLASYCMGFSTIEVPTNKTYSVTDLLHDIKAISRMCGVQNKGITFLITDKQINNKDSLEVIYSLLKTGTVPFLFTREELLSLSLSLSSVILPLDVTRSAVLTEENTDDNMLELFMSRVRNNLHIVFCLSPLPLELSDSVARYSGMSCFLYYYCSIFLQFPLIHLSR